MDALLLAMLAAGLPWGALCRHVGFGGCWLAHAWGIGEGIRRNLLCP